MWHGQKHPRASCTLVPGLLGCSPRLCLHFPLPKRRKKRLVLAAYFFLTWPNKAPDNDKQVSKTSGTSQGDLICRPVGGWSRMVLAALS